MKCKYLLAAAFLLLEAGCIVLETQYMSPLLFRLFRKGVNLNVVPSPEGWREAWNYSNFIDRQGQIALNQKQYQKAEGLSGKARDGEADGDRR